MTARSAAKVTAPPWAAPEHYDTAVLDDGRFITAGELVRVVGRRGDWEFIARVVSAKGEWFDVAEAGGGKNRRVVPVDPDKVTPARARKANR